MNLLCEFVDWLRGKLGIVVRERAVPRKAKVGIAAAVLALSAVCSVPVFELVNPISAVNKAVLFGSFAGVFTLVAIVFAELFWAHRVWCRALCPLGGMYETLGCVGLASVKIDHDLCVHCGACQAACLAIPKFLTMSFRARQAVLSQVITCCAGNAWMHVRIRPLKLDSRRRDILSCRRYLAIHDARGILTERP